VFSFGPALLLVGVIVLWMGYRRISPPAFIAWALAAWVVVTFVASGPSPLPILLIASALLLIESRREQRRARRADESITEADAAR
jgi:hypothetical protein